MGFTQDLKNGEEIEQEILSIIKQKFPLVVKEEGKFCREFYDIIIPATSETKEIKIEIKADLFKSKNMAFECLGRNSKPTGIIKTSSDYWVQFRNDKYYIWDTRKLRKYLLNVGGLLRNCGDGHASTAWIISEDKILKECPPKGIVNRKDSKLCDFI